MLMDIISLQWIIQITILEGSPSAMTMQRVLPLTPRAAAGNDAQKWSRNDLSNARCSEAWRK
jgi:hypothetical protein